MHDRQWTIVMDKGYQGQDHEIRAATPTKKSSGVLMTKKWQHNEKIAAGRTIVGNYFGREK